MIARITFISAMAAAALALPLALPSAAAAQFGDVSPVLLVETGPSDNPEYRRMVFVKYLSGDRVSVNYKAYNRTEFIQVPDATPRNVVGACANGRASSLREIEEFARAEAARKRRGQTPEIRRFCVKNVQNWEGGGRTRFMDPIFDGMPYAASLKG